LSENGEDVFSRKSKTYVRLTTLSKIVFVYRISVTNFQRIILFSALSNIRCYPGW